MIPSQYAYNSNTTYVQTSRGPIKAIHIKVPVGIPTADGGLEIPNRVFLGGITNEVTELELETFFCDYGLVKDVRIVTDRITGESKGYGFVTFDENEDISKLLANDTIVMKGKKLRVRKAIRRNSSQFVNNDASSDKASPDSTRSNSSTSSRGSTKSWQSSESSGQLYQPSSPSTDFEKSGSTEPVLVFPASVYGNSPYVSSHSTPNPSINQHHCPGGFYQTIAPTMAPPMPPHTTQHAVVSSSPPTPYFTSQPSTNFTQPPQPVYHGMPPSNYSAGYFVPVNTYYPSFGYPVY